MFLDDRLSAGERLDFAFLHGPRADLDRGALVGPVERPRAKPDLCVFDGGASTGDALTTQLAGFNLGEEAADGGANVNP